MQTPSAEANAHKVRVLHLTKGRKRKTEIQTDKERNKRTRRKKREKAGNRKEKLHDYDS